MVLHRTSPKPIPDDSSTAYTAATPPETVIADLDDLDPLSNAQPITSSVPWPGSTFIIRDASTGHVITLLDGELVLAPPGTRGSIHWACVDCKGWLGFQNVVSGRFLGHDKNGKLGCAARKHLWWENFCVRLRPEGGYVLLMTHYQDTLWHVGIVVEGGVEKLAKVGDGPSAAVVWEFVKI